MMCLYIRMSIYTQNQILLFIVRGVYEYVPVLPPSVVVYQPLFMYATYGLWEVCTINFRIWEYVDRDQVELFVNNRRTSIDLPTPVRRTSNRSGTRQQSVTKKRKEGLL